MLSISSLSLFRCTKMYKEDEDSYSVFPSYRFSSIQSEVTLPVLPKTAEDLENRSTITGLLFRRYLKTDQVLNLCKLCNDILKGSKVPDTWQGTRIMVILNKDPTEEANYRPISLPNQHAIFYIYNNYDIKEYINLDQCSFVKGNQV